MYLEQRLIPLKTFVIGVQGYIGNALFRAYQKHDLNIIGSHYQKIGSLKEIDLLNPNIDFLEIPFNEYSYAVIAAGITDVGYCERNPLLTFQINVLGIVSLTEQLLKKKVIPIIFSSDYVFDGQQDFYDEHSPPNPLNEYGRQKVILERELAQNFNGEFLLLRLSKIFGLHRGDPTFIVQMADSLIKQKIIRIAKDQVFCPLLIDDLIKIIFRLQEIGAKGVFNVCGNEAWRRLDLAQEICRALHVDEKLIQPISLDDLGDSINRPKRIMMTGKLHEKSFDF